MAKTVKIGPYSAYAIAVAAGYQGTEQEWLASLVGPQGVQGASVTGAQIDENGHLILTVHDPQTGTDSQIDAGSIDTTGAVQSVLQQIQQAGQDAVDSVSQSVQKAASSASEAENSANQAAQSASKAAASQSAAAGSAAKAGQSATDAANSATVSARSADAAAGSAAKAAQSAENSGLPQPTGCPDVGKIPVIGPEGTYVLGGAYAPIESAVKVSGRGTGLVSLSPTVGWFQQDLRIIGRAWQNGVPSVEQEVPIEDAGQSGSVELAVTGKNLMNFAEGQELGAGNVSQKIRIASREKITVTMSQTAVAFAEGGAKSAQHWHRFTDSQGAVLEQGLVCPMNFTNVGDTKVSTTVLTTPDNAVFLELFVNAYFGEKSTTIINNYTMVCYGSYPDGIEYAKYQGTKSLILPTPNGLPGIPVDNGGNWVDKNGQHWVSNVVDFASSNKTKACTLGTITYQESFYENASWNESDPEIFHAYSTDILTGRKLATNFMSNKFVCYNTSSGSQLFGRECLYASTTNNSLYIFIRKDRLETPDVAGLKKWLSQNEVSILYALEQQVVTPLTDEELSAYRAMQSYPGTTNILAPDCGIEASAVGDATKIIATLTDKIAALESSATGI